MGKFAAVVTRTLSTTQGVGGVHAAAASPRILEMKSFAMGLEADSGNPVRAVLQRVSTIGAGSSAITPNAENGSGVAPVAQVRQAYTTNPTNIANGEVLALPFNGRGTVRWSWDGELFIPAVANEGIALLTPVAAAVAASATFKFED